MLLYTYGTQRPIGTHARSLHVGTPAHVSTVPVARLITSARAPSYTTSSSYCVGTGILASHLGVKTEGTWPVPVKKRQTRLPSLYGLLLSHSGFPFSRRILTRDRPFGYRTSNQLSITGHFFLPYLSSHSRKLIPSPRYLTRERSLTSNPLHSMWCC